jgi:methylated-DNA-[protein]-cysteine S-methyltransferase
MGGAASGRGINARAVGHANARNPFAIAVPCHRVIGSDGSLTGYAGGLHAKSWLLQHEGWAPAQASLLADPVARPAASPVDRPAG